MTDFRAIILARLEHLGRSKYWLAERVGDNPSRATLYAYLRGAHEMKANHLARVVDALELTILPCEVARAIRKPSKH
jgi:hypothetical protein